MAGGLLVLGLGPGIDRARARTRGYVLGRVTPEKMRRLLDPGPDKLPAGYRFAGARIDKVAILAQYRSQAPGPELTVMLGHPSQTRGQPIKTRRFALLLYDARSRRAPRGREVLLALAEHVRRHEGSWEWQRLSLNRDEVHALRDRYLLEVEPVYPLQWHGWLLLALLVLGPLGSLGFERWRRRRTGAPDHPEDGGDASIAKAHRRDLFDLIALGVLLLFLVSALVPLLQLPITGDEATNLEPAFGPHWYLGGESSAHPPLFRFLIHLTAREVEPLWLLRGPVLLIAVGCLWLFWRLLRQRAPSPWLALACLVALASSGVHWSLAFQQKSLWLWLLLLLAAQGSFEGGLAGRRRRWALYSLWTTAALLTHYLTVAYVAGHCLHVLARRRRALGSLLVALLPAALAGLMLAVAVLQGGAGRISGYDPSQSFAAQLFHKTVLSTGLATLVVALPAVLLGPFGQARARGLLAATICGFGVTMALAAHMPLWPRYFFPVLPLGLLWLAGRLRWSPHKGEGTMPRRSLQWAALGLAGLVHFMLNQHRFANADRAAGSRSLFAAYLGVTRPPPGTGPPRILLVHPGWRFPMLVHQMAGRRHLRDTGCEGQRSPSYRLQGRYLLVAVSHDAPVQRLHRLARATGPVDLLLYSAHDGTTSPQVLSWIRAHCNILVRQRSSDRAESGAAYRCQVAAPGSEDRCQAVRRFFPRHH